MGAEFHGTTVVAVRRAKSVVIAGDGQVTLGQTVMKRTARKVQRLRNGKVLAGFAGSTADAFALAERFEAKLEERGGILRRAAVELAKDWRTDRSLRRLEALLVVADASDLLVISYALAAARALIDATDLSAREIAERSLRIASEICLYTNDQITVEELEL